MTMIKLVYYRKFLNLNVVFTIKFMGISHSILSKAQRSFKKGFTPRYSLITKVLKNGKKNIEKGRSCTTLITDLNKTFDCIAQDFLTAKFETYGLYDKA